MGVRIELKWIPSAVNRLNDALSRTWDPVDARAKEKVVNSIVPEYGVDEVTFRARLKGETRVASRKYLGTQMEEYWGAGVRGSGGKHSTPTAGSTEDRGGGGTGVLLAPTWTAQSWYARLRGFVSRMVTLGKGREAIEVTGNFNEDWEMVVAEIGCGSSRSEG